MQTNTVAFRPTTLMAALLAVAAGSAAAPDLGALSNPTSVFGGNPATGTLFLNAAPSQGNLTVQLAAADTLTTTVPATVVVPHGATSVSFPIATVGTNSGGSGSITATLGQESVQGQLTVNPAIPQSLTVSPSSVTGGAAITETIELNGQAGSAARISPFQPRRRKLASSTSLPRLRVVLRFSFK